MFRVLYRSFGTLYRTLELLRTVYRGFRGVRSVLSGVELVTAVQSSFRGLQRNFSTVFLNRHFRTAETSSRAVARRLREG